MSIEELHELAVVLLAPLRVETFRPRLERAGARKHELPHRLARLAGDRRVSLLELEHEGVGEERTRIVLGAPVDRIALTRLQWGRVPARDRQEARAFAPGRERDPPARLAHAGELAGDRTMVGSEDQAHRRRDGTKAP